MKVGECQDGRLEQLLIIYALSTTAAFKTVFSLLQPTAGVDEENAGAMDTYDFTSTYDFTTDARGLS